MCLSPTLAAATTNYQASALKTHISRLAWSISCLLFSGALAVFWQSGEGVPCVNLTCAKHLPVLMPISDLPFLSLLPDKRRAGVRRVDQQLSYLCAVSVSFHPVEDKPLNLVPLLFAGGKINIGPATYLAFGGT